jgi:Flp pilus assembly pilin Flp
MRARGLFIGDDGGATAIEYTLIAIMVGIVSIGALTFFGTSVSAKFMVVETNVSGAGS